MPMPGGEVGDARSAGSAHGCGCWGACVSASIQPPVGRNVVGPASSPGTAGAPAPVRPVKNPTMTPAAPRQRPLDSAERRARRHVIRTGVGGVADASSRHRTQPALQVSFERLGELGRYVAGRLPPAAAAGAGMSGPDYLEIAAHLCLPGRRLRAPDASGRPQVAAMPTARTPVRCRGRWRSWTPRPNGSATRRKVTTALPTAPCGCFVGTASRTGIRSGARSAVPRATVPQTGAAGRGDGPGPARRRRPGLPARAPWPRPGSAPCPAASRPPGRHPWLGRRQRRGHRSGRRSDRRASARPCWINCAPPTTGRRRPGSCPTSAERMGGRRASPPRHVHVPAHPRGACGGGR